MLIAPPESLVALAQPWANAYSHSKLIPTITTFLHLAPIIVGGGLAIAMDRGTLRIARDDASGRARHLATLGAAHRVVLGGLALSFLSGVALLAADLETFLPSPVFWVKMALVALLIANGAVMTRIEHGLTPGTTPGAAPASDPWGRLRVASMISLFLWLATTFVGVALVNVA